MAPIITLTTDFGLRDPFVGIMKGVILSICPTARAPANANKMIAAAGKIVWRISTSV